MSSLHQIHLLQQKLTHLEADNMIYQDQIQRLRKRIFSLEEYRIKYELLLEQQKEESPLGRSRRVDEINNMNKRIEENNEKWGMKMKVMEEKCQEVMRDLEEKNQMLEEKNQRLQIEVDRLQRGGTSRDKYANAIESSQLSLLKEQVTALKSRNATLSQQLSVTKHKNTQLLHKVQSLSYKQSSFSQLQHQLQEKLQQARYEEKEFYRENIVELEQRVEKLNQEVEYHKVRSSPEREQQIVRLNSEIKRIEQKHNTQISKFDLLLQHQTQQMRLLSSTLSTSKSESFSHTNDLQHELQQLTAKLLTLQQCHHEQLMACRRQMQQLRQQQVDLLKQSFQKIQNSHDSERQQWQLILKEQQHELQRIRLMWDGEKEKFAEQKNKLKAKINQLKAREKRSPMQEKSRNQNQTYKLISSLRQIDQEENAYNDHESNVTFLSRQLKRATNKIQEKQRQCAKLLNQLRVQRQEFQTQTEFIKKVERQQTHFYKEKLIEADLQNTKLLEQLRQLYPQNRQKDKQIRDTTASARLEHQTIRKQNHQLNDIIREMERDYNRLTDNKKNLFQQYRSQRDMVFTGKVQLNQQRKDKWLHLDRQKNQLQIAYKERERQIRVQYQLRINQLAQKLANTNQLKQLASAQNHILKERVQEYGQTFSKAENQQNTKDLHKKLATLDLQISLTQNLFSTIKSVRNRTQKTKSQLEQMSEHESLDSITSKEQKIMDLQNNSMDQREFEKDNVAPTFSRPSQEHVHREEHHENFSFKPHEPMIKVTKVSKNQPPESNLHQREGNDGDKTPAWGSF